MVEMFSWDDDGKKKLKEWTKKHPDSMIIGHSYGGSTAAEALQESPDSVTTTELVTVDPVSRHKPNFSAVRKHVTGHWTDIEVVGGSGTFQGAFNNAVAGVGGAWDEDNNLAAYADIIRVPFDHATAMYEVGKALLSPH